MTNARCGKKWLNSDEDEGFPFKCGCELWKISDYDKYRIRGELRYDVEEMIALLQNLLR